MNIFIYEKEDKKPHSVLNEPKVKKFSIKILQISQLEFIGRTKLTMNKYL